MSESSDVAEVPSSFSDRVAARAVEIRVLKIVLTLLALPFYVLGYAIAFVWVALRWIISAFAVGFSDAMSRARGPGDAAS